MYPYATGVCDQHFDIHVSELTNFPKEVLKVGGKYVFLNSATHFQSWVGWRCAVVVNIIGIDVVVIIRMVINLLRLLLIIIVIIIKIIIAIFTNLSLLLLTTLPP